MPDLMLCGTKHVEAAQYVNMVSFLLVIVLLSCGLLLQWHVKITLQIQHLYSSQYLILQLLQIPSQLKKCSYICMHAR